MISVAEAVSALKAQAAARAAARAAAVAKADAAAQERRDFYSSVAWRRLRYRALKASAGRCQCCGARGGDGVVLHVDHIEPISKNPARKLDPDNLQVMCEACNLGKSNADSPDWREPAPQLASAIWKIGRG